jgi:hypothetical protein
MCLSQSYYDEQAEVKRREAAAKSQPKPQETPEPESVTKPRTVSV